MSQSQAVDPDEKAGTTFVQLDHLEDLKATKEMILREAEYVLTTLSEDKAFWDDVAGEYLVCPRCGEQFNPQVVYPPLVSPGGLSNEAERFLRGEGCPSCRPDLFGLTSLGQQ